MARSNKIDLALEYAGRGWKVLALVAGSKIPARHFMQEHGVLDATDNPIHIRQIWDDLPEANIGIATGKASGLTVLDLDSEEAKIAMAQISHTQPPVTYGVKTPRGWHIYFAYDESVEQSAGRVKSCDVRNDGGYVVAGGSVVDGTTYTVISDKPVAAWDFPDVFKAQGRRNGVSPTSDIKRINEILLDGSGEGTRNQDTFDLAMFYRKQGLPDEEHAALLRVHNDNKNRPPLPDRDIENLIRSSLNYHKGQKLEYAGPLIEPPLIEAQTDRRSTFYWVETGIQVELSKISHFGSRTYCKIKIFLLGTLLYGPVDHSLYDERARKALRDTLREREPLPDWTGILHHIAHVVDTHTERQSDIIDLARHKPKRESAYLVYPVIRQNQATIIYADGGTGKSTFSLALAVIAASQQSFIPGIQPTANHPVRTLYLDWEASDDDASEMLDEIRVGAGITIPDDFINYKSMSGAFIDHADSLVTEIIDRGIELLIIDSLVASAGGDVTDAEAARYYFNAVRSLNVASVGITHTNKQGSLYGNRFFWNLARQVFRLTSVSESETDPIIGLYHEKANRSQLTAPMAWNVRYSGKESDKPYIKYETADIQSIPELAKGTGLRDRLIGLLRNGSLSVRELADRLDVTDTDVLVTLQRFPQTFLRREGIDNEWELTEDQM